MNNLRIAKIASLSSAVLLLLAGITSIFSFTIPSLIFGFLSVPAFIVMVTSLYYLTDQNKLEGLLGVVFAALYGTFISFNYFFQMAFIERDIPIPELMQMTSVDSIFLVVELLGYFFMGLSTLSLIPLLPKYALGKYIRILFFLNAILGVGGIVGYVLSWKMEILIAGLMVWNIIMPLAAFLLFLYFRQMKNKT